MCNSMEGCRPKVLAFNTQQHKRIIFHDASFYLQDTWSIKRRLTLNVGLRYDHFNTYYPTQNSNANETFPQLFPVQTYAASGIWWTGIRCHRA